MFFSVEPVNQTPSALKHFPLPFDSSSERCLAQLGHCRPIGVFLGPWQENPWAQAGGRDTCRKRLICPHFHARANTRLVGRVEEGPWRKSRRGGKQLLMLRFRVDSPDLDSDESRLTAEQSNYKDWIRLSVSDSWSEPNAETSLDRIAASWGLDQTFTSYEKVKAGSVLDDLKTLATLVRRNRYLNGFKKSINPNDGWLRKLAGHSLVFLGSSAVARNGSLNLVDARPPSQTVSVRRHIDCAN